MIRFGKEHKQEIEQNKLTDSMEITLETIKSQTEADGYTNSTSATGYANNDTELSPSNGYANNLIQSQEEFFPVELPIHTNIELDSIPNRDWNQEFNEVLESPVAERTSKLIDLEKEFVEVASRIGKIIISEKNSRTKTINPIPFSGIAGGEKYQVKNIFFKFAVDKNGLYGSDEYAMKVACHELKGHTALVSCGMMYGLKLGLITVIDYQGYRLTATSVLPISKDTLIYGSSDGGKVVCNSLEAMNKIMEKCGKVLNLKGHMAGIGKSKKFIYGPCDLEGHLGSDGRLYVIDLARLFPPETPERSRPGCFLYRLLRPELVRQFHKPLSSDAFTLFGEDSYEQHDAEVREATDFLHHQLIPEFSSMLSLDPRNEIEIEEIVMKLHRRGINIRFLGEVRSQVTNPLIRKLLLTEICARVFKNEIRKKLRESKSMDELHQANLCVNLFNLIFMETKLSRPYWEVIKKSILHRFKDSLSENEMKNGFDLRKHVCMELLYNRLQQQLGITLSAPFNDFPVTIKHFQQFNLKIKQMYAIPRIEADTAAQLARNNRNVEETKRLLALAIEKYNLVLELKPDDNVVLSSLFLSFYRFCGPFCIY